MSRKETLDNIYSEWLAEENIQANEDNQIRKEFTVKSFTSRSNGRGRAPRKSREVTLVSKKGSGKFTQFKPGEVYSPIDQWAEEVLEEITPPGTNCIEVFSAEILRLANEDTKSSTS